MDAVFIETVEQSINDTFSIRVTIEGKEIAPYENQTMWREAFLKMVVPIYVEYESLRKRPENNAEDFRSMPALIGCAGSSGSVAPT